jgi:outer membrane protein TolC
MKTLFLSLLLLSSGTAHAAATLGVDEAVGLALAQNPRLRSEQLDVRSADAEKLKAWSAQLPHVRAQAMHDIDNRFMNTTLPFNGEDVTFPAITPYTNATLQGSLLLFDGFSTWDRISAASLAQEAQRAELSRARFALETEIRTKFFQALGAAAMVAVADQNIAALEQHWKNANVMVKAGAATKFDTLRVETLLEDAKVAKLAAEDEKAIARKRLFQALGVPDDGRELSGSLPEAWDDLPPNLAPAPKLRDDRKAALLREESASKSARAQGKFWVPALSLFGQLDRYNNFNPTLFGRDSNYQTAYAVGVSLSWNVFDGGLSFAENTQAAVAAEKASLRIREIDDALPVDFEMWKRRYVHSVANFEARRTAIKKAQESIRIARTGARAGTRTNTEVLDAVRDLNEENAKLVQAQMDAVEALGGLELALGRTLEQVRIHPARRDAPIR